MRIVNLTPHPVTLLGVEIPPSGTIARVAEEIEVVRYIDWEGKKLPVIRKRLGEVQGLPPPQPDTVYIVSLLVAQAAMRADVLAIGESVRDAKGNIVGAVSLATLV
jgi:hypothetical protein